MLTDAILGTEQQGKEQKQGIKGKIKQGVGHIDVGDPFLLGSGLIFCLEGLAQPPVTAVEAALSFHRKLTQR